MSDDTDSVGPARKPISRRLRFEILRRDNYTCRYCGASAPDTALTVDHVIPITLGGGDDPTNLVTACQKCNAGKGSTSPDERIVADVDNAALLFARAMERASELRRMERAEERALLDYFDLRWNRWGWGKGEARLTAPLETNWEHSITTFVERGMSAPDLDYYIDVAMASKADRWGKWRYFCGCCWRELTNRNEIARRLIEDGKV